jgi:sugar phosphate isomerase/epimerase
MAALTYCTNIHAGEGWQDVMRNLNGHVLEVRSHFDPDTPFPLGLRISGQAAKELETDDRAIDEFTDWCRTHNCYLLTINGFPYGVFHNERVKENVYLPDWRDPERANYSKLLGSLATRLQPDAKHISISTVPIAFKSAFGDSDWPKVNEHIVEVATHYQQLYQQTGIKLVLAIEPEPLCILETIAEAVDFFNQLNLDESLREHVGLCFDCCHQAVEFEDAAECLQQIQHHQIPIGKVQVSSALKATEEEFKRLLEFDEPVYLHQAVGRQTGTNKYTRFEDLPDFAQALNTGNKYDQCRVHFHVPIFLGHLGNCGTTQDFLKELLPILGEDIPLEVETYSFSVLPSDLRSGTVAENITRELLWVRKLLSGQTG